MFGFMELTAETNAIFYKGKRMRRGDGVVEVEVGVKKTSPVSNYLILNLARVKGDLIKKRSLYKSRIAPSRLIRILVRKPGAEGDGRRHWARGEGPSLP